MKKIHAVTITLVSILTACGPLGLDCSQMGCMGSLTVTMSTDSLADSEYILTIERDDHSEQCTFILPFDSESASCDLGAEITYNEDVLTVQHIVSMGEEFDSVFVTVSEQDFNLFSETVDIDWSEPVYPNGEECDDGFGCRSAEISVDIN